jgi:UDP-N-acetylmuramoyl-L-alanyl-D-glutamate--2,6-diaminopimelate ligase
MQKISLSNKLNIPTIIIDFAHTPDALQRVLSDLFICKNSGKIILVFGCAGNRDKTKRAIMGNIAYNLADKIFITSDNSRNESFYAIFQDILSGINFNKNKIFCIIEDRKEAIKKAILEASNNDIVLIAGKGCEKIQEIRGDQKKISDNDIVKDILLEFF